MKYRIYTNKLSWLNEISSELFYIVQRRKFGMWLKVQDRLTLEQASTLKHNLDLISGNK